MQIKGLKNSQGKRSNIQINSLERSQFTSTTPSFQKNYYSRRNISLRDSRETIKKANTTIGNQFVSTHSQKIKNKILNLMIKDPNLSKINPRKLFKDHDLIRISKNNMFKFTQKRKKETVHNTNRHTQSRFQTHQFHQYACNKHLQWSVKQMQSDLLDCTTKGQSIEIRSRPWSSLGEKDILSVNTNLLLQKSMTGRQKKVRKQKQELKGWEFNNNQSTSFQFYTTFI